MVIVIALTTIAILLILATFAVAVDSTQRILERKSYERHRND